MDRKTMTRGRGARRSLAMWTTATVLAVGAAAAGTVALAQPAEQAGHHHAAMRGGPGAMPFPLMGRGLERMLDEVKASDAQRTQIRQIADAAAADLKAQRDTRRALHQRGMELFTAPAVDANAAEALRQQMLQQHDAVSKRTLQAMLDVSRVLTPEQRTQFAARMKERAERMRAHMERRGASAPR